MCLKTLRHNFARLLLLAVVPLLLFVLGMYAAATANPAEAESTSAPLRRVNAPFFAEGVRFSETAVFWFGQVDNQNNYTDVRVGYDQDKLWIRTATADRRLWYNDQLANNPDFADLPNWDAMTIYLDINNDDAVSPATDDYRFVSQLTSWEPRDNYQAAYRGDGANWVKVPYSITATSGWRGHDPNSDVNDRGWTMTYEIPFSALGLSGPPQKGSVWGLGVAMHDRDTAAGPPLPVKTWPEQMHQQQPATWGELVFGLPDYTPPPVVESGSVKIRHKLNGSEVTDAHVGGNTTCGRAYWPDFFDGWGDANYAGARQVNIQNLGDISDWTCFSKLYLTFPLDSVPANMAILSAQLTLHQFGGADVSLAKPSLIQVMTVNEPWREETITWNNAPLATENVAAAWADVLKEYPGWPGVPVNWDVSRAVASAYENGTDLQIVLYESDWAYHSGKYFLSSEEEDLNAVARPTLELVWGQPGFTLSVDPLIRTIRSGQSTSYTINVQHSPGLKENIALQVTNPSRLLDVSITPAIIAPPGGKATLIVKDKNGAAPQSGATYTLPITAGAGAIIQETSVVLLVNGRQTFLPFVAGPTPNKP